MIIIINSRGKGERRNRPLGNWRWRFPENGSDYIILPNELYFVVSSFPGEIETS